MIVVPQGPLSVQLAPRQLGSSNNSAGPSQIETSTQSTRSLPVERNEYYLNFKAALEFIPKEYDGYNVSASKFVRDCVFARDSVRPAERPLLLRLIRSRITGSADAYLQDREINCLEDLLSSIKLAFSPHQNLGQLQAMLSTVTQAMGESALQYGVRVSKLLKQLVDTIEQQYSNEVAYGMVRAARETALENYIRGLNANLELKVRFKNPATIQDAINIAQAAEWEVDYQNILRRDAHQGNQNGNPSVSLRTTEGLK